jgi:hypothetical protein
MFVVKEVMHSFWLKGWVGSLAYRTVQLASTTRFIIIYIAAQATRKRSIIQPLWQLREWKYAIWLRDELWKGF